MARGGSASGYEGEVAMGRDGVWGGPGFGWSLRRRPPLTQVQEGKFWRAQGWGRGCCQGSRPRVGPWHMAGLAQGGCALDKGGSREEGVLVVVGAEGQGVSSGSAEVPLCAPAPSWQQLGALHILSVHLGIWLPTTAPPPQSPLQAFSSRLKVCCALPHSSWSS